MGLGQTGIAKTRKTDMKRRRPPRKTITLARTRELLDAALNAWELKQNLIWIRKRRMIEEGALLHEMD